MSEIKNRVQPDLACPDGLAPAELRALLAAYSPPEVVDDFIELVERLPIASRQVREWGVRAIALADVEGAMTDYQIALAVVNSRCASPRRDFLRQFRELKKSPTKRRLLNVLERDRDENSLRPAESAIRFAIRRLGIFGNDIPPDWVERLGERPDLLRKVAETVCEHFAYKIDGRGRPRHAPLEAYADRLAEIYKALTGRPITYAKATDTSLGRKAGDPYGAGLDFMLAGLRLIDPNCRSYQAVAQLERIRTARGAS
jgi:hypothetical protein